MNDEVPDELKFQRYAHMAGMTGSAPEDGGRLRKKRFSLSPAAFHGCTNDKTVRWALGEKIRSLAGILRRGKE